MSVGKSFFCIDWHFAIVRPKVAVVQPRIIVVQRYEYKVKRFLSNQVCVSEFSGLRCQHSRVEDVGNKYQKKALQDKSSTTKLTMFGEKQPKAELTSVLSIGKRSALVKHGQTT